MNRILQLIGVEDGRFPSFPKVRGAEAVLCCVHMTGIRIDRVQFSNITVDGTDATDKLLSLLGRASAEAIIMGGITFAGFNFVDPRRVHRETNIPVIIISRDHPDVEAMLSALRRHFEDWSDRWRIIGGLKIHKTSPRENEPPLFYEAVGCSTEWARGILRYTAAVCRIPEPVRVSRLIARGVSPFC